MTTNQIIEELHRSRSLHNLKDLTTDDQELKEKKKERNAPDLVKRDTEPVETIKRPSGDDRNDAKSPRIEAPLSLPISIAADRPKRDCHIVEPDSHMHRARSSELTKAKCSDPKPQPSSEDIIIPFEITPPRLSTTMTAGHPGPTKEMQDLARSFRLTFGKLHDNPNESKPVIPSKPREVRIPVHHRTISTESPDSILAKIKECLLENGFSSQWRGPYCLICEKNDLGFELEICSLPNLDINGIRFSRISGDIWLTRKFVKKF